MIRFGVNNSEFLGRLTQHEETHKTTSIRHVPTACNCNLFVFLQFDLYSLRP